MNSKILFLLSFSFLTKILATPGENDLTGGVNKGINKAKDALGGGENKNPFDSDNSAGLEDRCSGCGNESGDDE